MESSVGADLLRCVGGPCDGAFVSHRIVQFECQGTSGAYIADGVNYKWYPTPDDEPDAEQMKERVETWTKLATGKIQVANVYVMPNGMCLVFDQDGHQINVLQGRWSEVRDLVESCAGEPTNWYKDRAPPDTPPEPENQMNTEPIEHPTNVQGMSFIPEVEADDAKDDALVSRWILRQLEPSVRDSAREWRDRAVRRAVLGTIDIFLKKLNQEESICSVDTTSGRGARESIQALRLEVEAVRDRYPTP